MNDHLKAENDFSLLSFCSMEMIFFLKDKKGKKRGRGRWLTPRPRKQQWKINNHIGKLSLA
jgi:hypothetical protein